MIIRFLWRWTLLWLSLLLPVSTPLRAASPEPAAWYDGDGAAAFDDDTLFLVGNTLFTIYHELGHALIDLLDLPVIGREEDAVDGFAAVTMIPETPDDVGDALIIAAADSWRVLSEAASGDRDRRYWAEHALDEQRHFAIVCLLVGSDQEGFYDYAVDAGLPDDRIATCADDFARMRDGWNSLLDPYRVDGTEATSDSPIHVMFDTPLPEHERIGDLVRQGGLLEDAVARFGEGLVLPSPVTIRFVVCDEANAYWSLKEREVLICYELIDEFEAILLGAMVR